MPVYDKPMIYYPLSTLMLAGIKDILIISTPQDLPRFGTCSWMVPNLESSFLMRNSQVPMGLAQAFLIGEEFIGDDSVALILGINLYHGPGLRLQEAAR